LNIKKKVKNTINDDVDDDGLIILIILCAFSSFLFGWHVHEKAVLLILMPLSCLSIKDAQISSIYFLMSFISNYSLFPLIFRVQGNNSDLLRF
jgi:TRAP-type C4-dicarboxylate transport system permease large subunit